VKGIFGFTRKERIIRSEDFRRVLKTGRRFSSRNLVLFRLKNETSFPRLGIVVKKEVGSAVYRNRIKRYARECFRLNKHEIREAFDLIVLVKKGCTIARFVEAEQELKGLLLQ
jgi:ribonuclease P protein component